MPNLFVISGPTASGKSSLAIEVCAALEGEVVSADSMQVYKHMDIATAKPSVEDRARVRHHLVSVIEPDEQFSVAKYAALAHSVISEIHARGKTPVLCGGTGLYIQAVVENLQLTPGEITSEGAGTWEELYEIDPAYAKRIHPNDQKRISHAIALFRSTGVTLTEQNARSRDIASPYDARMIFLNARDRKTLYDRIDKRVDVMIEAGLVEEAKLENTGITAKQAIGHKELQGYFDGVCSLDEAAAKLKRETRRYAKRQLSWFRRMAREWNARSPGSCAELFIEEDYMAQAIAFLQE